MVFTDGACKRQEHESLRRAGCGWWWSDGNARFFYFALPGLYQSNQRAELLAAVRVCESDPRSLDIRSDSKFVVDGCSRIARGAPAQAHSDVWERIAPFILSGRVTVTKVLGHAKWRDVHSGRETLENKLGNGKADELAVAGAASHEHHVFFYKSYHAPPAIKQ